MAHWSALIKGLENMGIPDKIGFFGGLRQRVGELLVRAVRDKGEAVVRKQVGEVITEAAAIVKVPTSTNKPDGGMS